MRKIRFVSWKYPYSLRTFGCLRHHPSNTTRLTKGLYATNGYAPQVLLDLNLPTNLLLHLALDDFGLVETFEGEDVAWGALGADHVHAAKLAFSEWTAHVKVGQVPLACGTVSARIHSFVSKK